MTIWGAPIISGFATLYVANGWVIGWRKTYDVMIGITSPADTGSPGLAWIISIAGWLIAPGVVGAVAGYVVTSSIARHRRVPLEQLFPEGDDG